MRNNETIDDAVSITTVVEQYSDMVLRIAWQQLLDHASAEDVVQEVFLKLLSAPSFSSEAHRKAWLIRVTLNQCHDVQRSVWNRRRLPMEAAEGCAAPELCDLRDELFHLPPKDRTVLYLYYYEGYQIAEIAQILKRRENTISSRLTRARQKMKKLLLEGEDFDDKPIYTGN